MRREKKFPGTLQRISLDSKELYTTYRAALKRENSLIESNDYDKIVDERADELAEFLPDIHYDGATRYAIEKQLGIFTVIAVSNVHHWYSRTITDKAQRHYQENMAQYHELALTDAYMQGYDIQVSESLIIGNSNLLAGEL